MKKDSPLNDILIGKVTTQWALARGFKVFYEAETASTNHWAKAQSTENNLDSENFVFTIYLTDSQTSGRGRSRLDPITQKSSHTTWENARPGTALLSSWVTTWESMPQPYLTPWIGLAVWRALQTTWPFLNLSLKAPNDIYIDDKKLAGLLIESTSSGGFTDLIIGLGLNVLDHPQSIISATDLGHSLKKWTALLGEDWIYFLDHLVLEWSVLFEKVKNKEVWDVSSDKHTLLFALNKNPLLTEPYIDMTPDGTLITASQKKIKWMEL